MTMESAITCPHCGAAASSGSAFCEKCGKALPSPYQSGPRVVSADALPQTAAGQQAVGEELMKQQKRASVALLIVAILQTTCGMLVIAALTQTGGQPGGNSLLYGVQLTVAAIFWGLWFWSRKHPLPATIVGLVLYATLVVINVVTAMSDLTRDPETPRTGIGGLGIGIVDIIIMVILGQAIAAGVKYKRLMESARPTL